MSLKIYLDSNLWINYLWIKKVASLPKKFAKHNKSRQRSYEIVNYLLNQKAFKRIAIVSSLFNGSEISGYFRDYLRFLRGLNLGYDYTNCHKYKQSFRLFSREKKEITSYFEYIGNLKAVEVVEPKLDGKSLEFFRLATCDYYLDYMDAFHLLVALMEGCKYLITEDKDFKGKGNKLLRNNELLKDIRLINSKEATRLFDIPRNT